jgi:hypothetical protein
MLLDPPDEAIDGGREGPAAVRQLVLDPGRDPSLGQLGLAPGEVLSPA